MRISKEEIFGPVASVIKPKHYEEALATANDTEFGLASGIATTALEYATHFKRHSPSGMVMVNLPTAGVDYHVPLGGRKGSSYGSREQGKYAAEFFTTVKTAYTNAGRDCDALSRATQEGVHPWDSCEVENRVNESIQAYSLAL